MAAQAISPESSDFTKLIDSLLGREIVSVSPTEFQVQENSVNPPKQGKETNARDKTNPRERREAGDQPRSGLVAMMTAAILPNRIKPPLSLDAGRLDGEDCYIKSSEPEPHAEAEYVPEIALPRMNAAAALTVPTSALVSTVPTP